MALLALRVVLGAGFPRASFSVMNIQSKTGEGVFMMHSAGKTDYTTLRKFMNRNKKL